MATSSYHRHDVRISTTCSDATLAEWLTRFASGAGYVSAIAEAMP